MSEYLSNETTHVPRDSVQFHLCGPSTRLIILREGKNGACWRGKEDENVTGKSGHVYSREKQNAETGPASGTVVSSNVGDDGRQNGGGRGTTKKEGVPAESRNITAGGAGAASRRLTAKKKDPRAIYWSVSREFMRRFALAGGFTRNEKPKFLSNPPLPLAALSTVSLLILYLPLYMRLEWSARNWRS